MSVSLFLLILVSAHVYGVFICISCEGVTVTYTYIRPWEENVKMKIKHFILFFVFVHFPFYIRV